MSTGTISSSTGLSSGIDYNSLLTKLRQASSGPITIASRSQAKLQNQKNAMAVVQKAFEDFKTKATALQSRDNFLTTTATSTDGSYLLANATNSASAGTYSVQVKQLAAADRIAGQGVATADNTSVVNADGTLSLKVGSGATVDVAITAGQTLNQLRDAINAKTTKVKASVINTGSATEPYRLVLTATDTGAANKVTVTGNGTTLNFATGSVGAASATATNTFNGTVASSGTYTGANSKNIVLKMTTAGGVGTAKYKVSYDGGLTFGADDAFTTSASAVDVTGVAAEGANVTFGAGTTGFSVGDTFSLNTYAPQLQKAQDAILNVDGVQVSRASNTISDVIDGVTLTARKVDTNAQTVQVLNSNSAVAGKVNEFVTAYNALVNTVKAQTKYDVKQQSAAALFGDSTLGTVLESLRQSIVGYVPELPTDLTFNSVGIKIDSSGALAFDSTKFNDALNKNIEGVVSLFVQAGKSSSNEVAFSKATSDTRIGTHAINITTVAEQATVSGTQTLSGGLAATEVLTVSDKTSSAIVTLQAGATLSSVIGTLNDTFATKGLKLTASDDNGKLRITTTEYGSDQVVRVVSDQDPNIVGQLGLGSVPLTDAGVNVAGTIAGVTAKGEGRVLKAESGDAKGLELNVTTRQLGLSTVTLSRGVAQQIVDKLTSLTDSKNGLFTTRNESYDKQIKAYDDRIEAMGKRLDDEQTSLRKKFNALETQLSQLQTQGNFLTTQLASLITTNG